MNNGVSDGSLVRQLLTSQRIRRRRSDLGLTQQQVVTRLARSGVPTTNRAVSALEHGAGLDVAKLPGLAAALDCTVTYLVGLTDDPGRWEPDERVAEPAPERHSTDTPPGNPAGPRRTEAHRWILGPDIPDRGSRLAGMNPRSADH